MLLTSSPLFTVLTTKHEPLKAICLVGVIALIMLQGCAQTGTTASQSSSTLNPSANPNPETTEQWQAQIPPDTPLINVIKDLPFYAQETDQCGPAVLATLLDYRGRPADMEELKQSVYLPDRSGSLTVEMVARARQSGLLAYPLDKNLASLITEINAGNPVIVMQNLRFGWWPKWHFAVAKGYDLTQQKLLLNTGTQEDYWLPFKLFSKTWQRAEQWALVITQPSSIPATAEPIRFLQAANDLEQVNQISAANTAYQTAFNQWPKERLTLFSLANLNFGQKKFQRARIQFDQLTKLFDDYAPGWNNYAYLLAAEGCYDSARYAARCAYNLAEDKQEYQSTVEEIEFFAEQRGQSEGPGCPVLYCPAN